MSVKDKILYWFGGDEDVDDSEVLRAALTTDPKAGAKVLGFPPAKMQKIVVCEPETFEEAQAITDHLKNRKQVIINFEKTPVPVSKEIIDFVSGAAYALDGQSQQLGQKVFLFAPSGVEISKESRTGKAQGTDNPI